MGLSDQLVHERVEFERYTLEAQLLQTEGAALNENGVDEQTQVRCSGPRGGAVRGSVGMP